MAQRGRRAGVFGSRARHSGMHAGLVRGSQTGAVPVQLPKLRESAIRGLEYVLAVPGTYVVFSSAIGFLAQVHKG